VDIHNTFHSLWKDRLHLWITSYDSFPIISKKSPVFKAFLAGNEKKENAVFIRMLCRFITGYPQYDVVAVDN